MFGVSEIGLIVILAVLLFGGSQIPKLAKSLGRAKKDFQDGLNEGKKATEESESAEK